MLLAARRLATIVFVSLVVVLSIAVRPASADAATAYYLSTTGSDTNIGSAAAPFRTFTVAMKKLRPGDTLVVSGGTYTERVILKGSDLTPGTADARITVVAAPGERVVIEGLFWLSNASYYTIDGINVTWGSANTSSEHMARFYNGTGQIYRNAELWGARSYAALLIDGGATNWNLNHLYIHDTYATNSASQDQLIYVAGGSQGVIEYNLLVNAPNGRGIKLGMAQAGNGLPSTVTVRYNTIVNSGAGNISFSYDAHDNTVQNNIFVSAGSGYASVGAYQLTGAGNAMANNVYWQASGIVKTGTPLVDGGQNVALDPLFDSSYMPTNAALLGADGTPLYGHLADMVVSSPAPVTPAVVHDAAVTAVTAPASVTQGSSATISATIVNQGSVSEAITVSLNETPNGAVQTQTVTLAAGAAGTLNFTWATTLATATGAHTFTVQTSLDGDLDASDNSGTTTTSVQAPSAPVMSVSSLTLTSTKLSSSYRLRSTATIVANGNRVSGATVTVEWTMANGSKVSQTTTTNSLGVATVSNSVATKGTYTIRVINVVKTGMTFSTTVAAKTLTIS